MAINALIAQGVTPIGEGLSQTYDTLQRNALAQQQMGLQQQSFDLQKGNALFNQGQVTRENKIQDKQLGDKEQADDRNWAATSAQILASIKDPNQFNHVADSFAADPRAQKLGITRDQITPQGVQQFLAQTQATAGQLPYEQTPGYKNIQAQAAEKQGEAQQNYKYRLGEIAATGAESRKTNDAKAKVEGLPGGAGTPGAPNGDAYLSSLPPNISTQVKALADGRMAFPSGMALKTPYWQQMISAVSQYDPNFDAVNYNARAKTRADFTSGKNAQNIKALNTAIGHLGNLDEQISGTASRSFTPWNHLSNASSEMMGDAGPTQFKQSASAVASELTQVFRGTGGAEADVKRYLEELNVNGSKEQKKAAVQNIVSLLNSRLNAIGDQYNQGMGKTEDPLTLLNPHAQQVLSKINSPAPAASGGWKVTPVP